MKLALLKCLYSEPHRPDDWIIYWFVIAFLSHFRNVYLTMIWKFFLKVKFPLVVLFIFYMVFLVLLSCIRKVSVYSFSHWVPAFHYKKRGVGHAHNIDIIESFVTNNDGCRFNHSSRRQKEKVKIRYSIQSYEKNGPVLTSGQGDMQIADETILLFYRWASFLVPITTAQLVSHLNLFCHLGFVCPIYIM